MITIALPKEIGGKGFITIAEVKFEDALAKRISWDMFTPRATPRDITIEEREINCIKSKSSRLSWILMETIP